MKAAQIVPDAFGTNSRVFTRLFFFETLSTCGYLCFGMGTTQRPSRRSLEARKAEGGWEVDVRANRVALVMNALVCFLKHPYFPFSFIFVGSVCL